VHKPFHVILHVDYTYVTKPVCLAWLALYGEANGESFSVGIWLSLS